MGAFSLDARENGAGMVAKIDCKLHQLIGTGDFLHLDDGANANVQRFQGGQFDRGLDRGRRKVGHPSPPEIRQIAGQGNRGIAMALPQGCATMKRDGDHPGPNGKIVIRGIIFGRAGAHLGRDFHER